MSEAVLSNLALVSLLISFCSFLLVYYLMLKIIFMRVPLNVLVKYGYTTKARVVTKANQRPKTLL